jgi:hypothetical protein
MTHSELRIRRKGTCRGEEEANRNEAYPRGYRPGRQPEGQVEGEQ